MADGARLGWKHAVVQGMGTQRRKAKWPSVPVWDGDSSTEQRQQVKQLG